MRAIYTSTTLWNRLVLAALTTGLLTSTLSKSTLAQVISSDNTTGTLVTPAGSNFTIRNGTESGSNLFHSFSSFSVPATGRATFDLVNTPNIRTIFSRVTGSSVSSIDGIIETLNGNNPVSLFLMNPNGIIFGSGARINIGGSFVGTTASSIKFTDGTEFSAVNPGTPPALLTMSVPIGLQMGSNPQPIQVNGQGNDGIVPTNNLGIIGSPPRTVALVGGDVTFTGGVITAPAGRIEVGAVGSGTVNLVPTPTGLQLDYAQVQDFRDINFTQRSSLWNPNPATNPFGGIQVVGRDIRLDQSQIAGAAVGSAQGSNITVNAARSLFLGGVNPNAFAPSAWIVNQTTQGSTGNGGGINIKAGNVTLVDGAAIETFSLGSGASGKVQVTADTITASGVVPLISPLAPTGTSSSRIGSQNYGAGNGGDVSIVARKLTLDEGGFVGTTVFPGATGKGGNISVDVADEMIARGISPVSITSSGINAYTFGIGKGGDIKVSAGTLNLIEGGTVLTFSTRFRGVPGTGIGDAGDISVVARNGVNIVGTSPVSPSMNTLLGSATAGAGNSGNVSVTSSTLFLSGGGSLGTTSLSIVGNFGDPRQANNLGNSGSLNLNVSDQITLTGINPFTLVATGIGIANLGNGKTGDITIQTNQLQILDGAKIGPDTLANGLPGTFTIQANDILIDGKNVRPSAIQYVSPVSQSITRQFYNLPAVPTGNIGVLNISTNKLTVRNGGTVNVAHEGAGDAGELDIQANEILLDGGSIKATTASGQGGDLNLIVGNTLVLRNGSKVTATAGTATGDTGNGGNININAPIIVGLEDSDIIANAFDGNGGNITITTQGIFGLKYRPQLTPENDITASSEVFGANGTVQINTIGVDPNSGLVELPANIIDPSQNIAKSCAANTGSQFVITGRGGIPQNPLQELRRSRTWNDARDISTQRNIQTASAPAPAPESVPKQLVEATNWHRNEKGKVELVAARLPQVQDIATCAMQP